MGDFPEAQTGGVWGGVLGPWGFWSYICANNPHTQAPTAVQYSFYTTKPGKAANRLLILSPDSLGFGVVGVISIYGAGSDVGGAHASFRPWDRVGLAHLDENGISILPLTHVRLKKARGEEFGGSGRVWGVGV